MPMRYSVAALYERRLIGANSWRGSATPPYKTGGHRPPLQARPLAAKRAGQAAEVVPNERGRAEHRAESTLTLDRSRRLDPSFYLE
jgi:branched-subunit amino acid aminotransferase/4-amino-4-deoxychorismate lyase